ncbi:hypothetical protein L3X38_025986 [Prunus dulcis]|uniref:Uncharacterized protein n=1 Tax=Prunus dulcis TaxID=3755 RepID=A0AAD4W5G4_PRUDU|nr:hypothetical protein L3X38_025986 [Prunus dulcis]
MCKFLDLSIGYPDWWDHSKAPCKNRGKSLNTSSDSALVSPAVPTAPAPASAFIATTGTQIYVLHSSSKKHTWVTDTGATDHMTFDPGQLTSHAPSSQSVVSNANGTLLQTFSTARRLVVVLGGANSTISTWHLTVKLASVKLTKLGVRVLRRKIQKYGYGITVLDILHLDIYISYFLPYFPI